MAMPDYLRNSEMWKHYTALRDAANANLQAVLNQYPDQLKRLSDWMGTGIPKAEAELANLAERGVTSIPQGLRQDVIDAYNQLAQTMVDAPDELKPFVDGEGLQELRTALTGKASQLMSAGEAAAGAGGVGAVASAINGATGGAVTAGAGAVGLASAPGWAVGLMALGVAMSVITVVGLLAQLLHKPPHEDIRKNTDVAITQITTPNGPTPNSIVGAWHITGGKLTSVEGGVRYENKPDDEYQVDFYKAPNGAIKTDLTELDDPCLELSQTSADGRSFAAKGAVTILKAIPPYESHCEASVSISGLDMISQSSVVITTIPYTTSGSPIDPPTYYKPNRSTFDNRITLHKVSDTPYH